MPQSHAFEIGRTEVRESGDNLMFKVSLIDFNKSLVYSVRLYYSFESSNPRDDTWKYKNMAYNNSSKLWETSVKKDASRNTIHYYVSVNYNGTSITDYEREYGYGHSDSRTDPMFQAMCIAAFFIFFIVFELVMRYPLMKAKKRDMEEEENAGKMEEGGITKCPHCGKIIPEKSERCPYCGSELVNSESGNQSKEITMGDN